MAKIHAALPDTKIAYITIKPSIARWHLIDQIRQANRLIQDFTAFDERLSTIDVYTPMLGPGGRPWPDIFVEDDLHLNRKGYDIWTRAIREHLLGLWP